MSSYPQETIIVNGREMFLRGDSPLEQLWSKENRPIFIFQLHVPERKLDYAASWIIKDNFLQLVGFQCESYTAEELSLRGDEGELKAIWYSGDIVYETGTFKSSSLGSCHSDYATYEVVKGEIVIESYKEIRFEPPNNYGKFLFGKHKGREIRDVINGINKNNIIREYLEEAILSFQHNNKFNDGNVYLPVPIDEYIDNLSKYKDRLQMSVRIDKYVFLKGHSRDAERIKEFGDYIMECFSHSFYSTNESMGFYREHGNKNHVSLKSLSIKSDLQYVVWVVDNIEKFDIQPHIICEIHACKGLKGFNVQRIAYDIILFQPIIKEFNYSFPERVINTCINRCLKKYNLRYDVEKKWYVKVKPQAKHEDDNDRDDNRAVDEIDYNELYFDAMTDGQLGDYDDFKGDVDNLDSWSRG